jgi:hypothetical protein
MALIPQEVQIITSRWQKKADKTFLIAQHTQWSVLTHDQKNTKENLLIMFQYSSVNALSPSL